ncbi:MAG: ABC transporter permease [Gemmatimonadales bacterium]
MPRTFTIFRKELIDTLRDRRTLIMMIVVPVLLVPIMLLVVVKVGALLERKASEKQLKIAVVGAEYAPDLHSLIASDSLITVIQGIAIEDVAATVREDSVDGAIVIPSTFLDRINADRQAAVQLYYQSTRSLNVVERRLRDIIEEYAEEIVGRRIERLNLDAQLFDAIEIVDFDVATVKERIGETAGRLLPYMFILFCFMGSMYPGIDLGAGEKERGTLETLLSSPASRLEIVLGKFLVISLIGLASAMISIGGLYIAVLQIKEIPEQIMAVITDILNLTVLGMIVSLLIPLEAFFAAVILAVSIYSKSFKEAQSSLTPMSFVVIVPVLIGLMPGVELTWKTALIPILNVSLASKDVISAAIDPTHLALVYVSLLLLASVSIVFCVKWFNREATLFRG